jgi:hypothetical protein
MGRHVKGIEVKKTIDKSVVSLIAACVFSIATPLVSATTVDISNATVTAWSTTGTTAGSPSYASATPTFYAGLGYGVTNSKEDGTSPEHSMDNANNTDMLEFTFGSTIDLDNVTIGWRNTPAGQPVGDTDISVLAYTGAGAPPTITGETIAQLLTGGWKLVGNYANLTVGTAQSVNTTNISSKYWLVSSYDPVYTTATGGTTPAPPLSAGDDYVKILALSGTVVPPPTKVPEPGSLALFAAAAFGLYALRRRGGQRRDRTQGQQILQYA